MKRTSIIILGLAVISLAVTIQTPQSTWTKTTPVAEALFTLGEAKPTHHIVPTDEMVAQGKELVTLGRTVLPNGQKSAYISKYYTCTSCHNITREDPDLTTVDPDARLAFAIKNRIPYLQASTFWGIVNRESWYNDDYVLKYGSLVEKARNSLQESVQLCATVCAQGRNLNEWEMDRILAYFWSLQLQLGDLSLTDEEWSQLQSNALSNDHKRDILKSKYLQKSPATFGAVPENKQKGYPETGNPKLGKGIYELGCQHCHRPEGESEVIFDHTPLTYNWLKKHIPDNSQLSIYEIIRKGTYAEYGHQEYMPHYTIEKMSDQQVEHLRAFIENPF